MDGSQHSDMPLPAVREQSRALVLLPDAELIERDADDVLSRHVGVPGASQRSALPDIWYLWGPGRLLSNQTTGVSAAMVLLAAGLCFFTWDFALKTLALLISLFIGPMPAL